MSLKPELTNLYIKRNCFCPKFLTTRLIFLFLVVWNANLKKE